MVGQMERDLLFQKRTEKRLAALPKYVLEWYYNLRASNLSASTCCDYVNKVKGLLDFVSYNDPNIKIEEITQTILDQYFISIKTKEKGDIIIATSDSFQQTVWCALNNFFEFLFKRGYIKINYIKQIHKPKNKDLDRINEHRIQLTKEDFNKMLLATQNNPSRIEKSRDYFLLSLFMVTGIRRTALEELNLDNLDLRSKQLYVIDKGNKRHSYYLSDDVVNIAEKYLIDREKYNYYCSNALFLSIYGNRISSNAIYNIVQKYSKKALGKKISPHKLRAGFCSILYEETHDAEFVRRAVGHSNIATTQRYIVTGNKEREEARNIMNTIFQ